MKKLTALTTVVLALTFTGCPIIKPIARTVIDLAREACSMYAEQTGFSVEDACKTEEQLRPFIDAILAGQAAASKQREGTGACGPATTATPSAPPVAPPAPTTAPVAPPAAPTAAPVAPPATATPAAPPATPVPGKK
jgi:hypothetical protein